MKFFTVFILLLTIHGFVGQETSTHNFPWMVLVGPNNESTQDIDDVCGGSIISDTFVITAAHCFSGDHMNFTRFSIRAGILNTSNASEATEQIHTISAIFVHPNYTNTNTSFLNDVALVRVSSPFNFTTGSVGTLSLSNETSIENMTLVTIGWSISNRSNTSEAERFLQQITVQNITECTQNESTVATTQLCATVVIEDPQTCVRDNGSPLMIYLNDSQSYELVGVTSYREVCFTAGVFTRIPPFDDWIWKILSEPPSTTASPTSTSTTTSTTSTSTTTSTTSTSTTSTTSTSTSPPTTPSTSLTSTPPPTITSTTSTSRPTTVTNRITTTAKNNAIVIESKLFLVLIICMLFNAVLIN